MGVKQLADGRWKVDIQKDGMPRKRKTFRTEAAANQFEQDYIKQHTPDHTVKDKRRLRDLIDLWGDYHGYTLANYEARMNTLRDMARALHNPVAELLKPETVVQYRAKRLKSIKPKTWNNHLGLLKSVYNKLIELDIINYPNPIEKIKPIRIHEEQLAYLSVGEIERLLDEIKARGKNPSTWWVTQICLRTGARWGEAEQMKAKQVHDGKVTFEFTKGKRVRSIPLSSGFFAKLEEEIAGKGANERIFTNCEKAFRHAVGRAEIETPDGQMTHLCRHTFASHFVINGGNILTLQKILGHTDIKMTLRYAHLAPDHLEEAVRLAPVS